MTPYVPNCATPLIFETEVDDYPYGMAGTGFLIMSNGSFFFLTANHCLTGGDHERLRVPRSFATDDLLELAQFGKPIVPPNETDTDWLDIATFSVMPEGFAQAGDRDALEPAYLANTDTRHLLRKGVILTVRGFPKSAPEGGIDVDARRIKIQALTCDARFLRATNSVASYELQFVETCPVDDFDHMSGSPVFANLPDGSGRRLYILVGILLRAGGPDRLGRFVSIEVVKKMLEGFADPASRPIDNG
jgi:hypothetical protein